eukprot:TRINITY_DN3785_c0_g1_i2.p1 TRINITY_DN3785_c0_g1~~TRINITY_DN3785_c0_g1_i2.p1  ORF type:complete len:178 (-),score=51.88 TRINITY_DN3785_c0_g1_i2:53-586(-)
MDREVADELAKVANTLGGLEGKNRDFLGDLKEDTKQTTTEPVKDFNSLPSAFKYQILSYLDPTTLNKTLALSAKNNKLEPVHFLENLDDDKASLLKFFTKEDLKALDEQGYVIRDNFLGSTEAQAVRSEAEKLKDEGKLKLAGMSHGSDKWNDNSVRGDLHLWLNDRTKLLAAWYFF